MTESKQKNLQLILDTCLLAGKIMTESGSEVYRVEDTMNRIAENAGQKESVSYVTATGLFMGFRSSNFTQLENVTERSINLEKVAIVNNLSRQFANQEISLTELNHKLVNIDTEAPTYSMTLQIFAAGIVSCTLMYIFGGSWDDFLATFFIGMTGFSVAHFTKEWLHIKFLDDFLASFTIGLLAYFAVTFHLAGNVDNIIIGAVMPLVPGVAITNSFRDILAGHLLSGTARATEAVFIAGSIGIGIAIVFKLFM
ncbi:MULTISPECIES: threonine/serine exporter family protein [unclassified Enterococcus]|uniref:threonine/serine exporter family protein n=1 Tax=unclassified Enterococcus TaxID=2608891 RepID=UPI001CE1A784|nr:MULTISPECIES: threonine/serine exporter family protein [unclassified Enterococcus]MCA5012926.1 threonine/serine exporter family protein [Enterococcus sp. S23]MCA5016177.1 threonine/serine exporter family protein [Enterococcus sp. S22(2020)]